MKKKFIDAEKLLEDLKKTMESYKSKMVDPTKYPIDHIDLMAFLAREYQAILSKVESLQQEQPEVDLEKEFAHEYAIYHLPTFIIASIVDGTELIDFIYKTAHHFWNKGYNARKEE